MDLRDDLRRPEMSGALLQDQPNEAYRPAISLGELDLARCKVRDFGFTVPTQAFPDLVGT